ncbi:3-methyl-2-oxobutanoate hydroxymethyltransferase [Persicirhabdus sediminis]|uniref:3-methyl-2-oxobutanoate hydroxymethyltransferase n=1 Tax=Persicirhabdus sediminis TaxID=454144 RepID=A0A8J7MEB5_9BACT|nr:3-methyl-2-oxobutanoate hydroxymethyltransferase [Persicirhabdus sediminis]MBK1791120.1 3-methyl-2-oxobutanoate hydroxymethyltransferase [Persicirhabdus sediminis]
MTGQEKAEAIRQLKGERDISALTAYDYPTARLLDEVGVDVLLVGDSLGMVVLGYPDTTHVTMDHMVHHVAAVARGSKNALVIGDLPINSYNTPEQALENARRLVEAGADCVKLEGGVRQVDKVRAIVSAGIPVIGHHGMLPQRVLEEGGYHKKGKSIEEAKAITEGVTALQAAGCSAVVLESVVPALAKRISEELEIPTIGIGCGKGNCDGEVAVITDITGAYPWFVPPFAYVRADFAGEMKRVAKEYINAI